jgi:hypothetical protein
MTEANPDGMRHFWTLTPDALCAELGCSRDGLSTQDAEARLGRYGPNADAAAKRTSLFARSHGGCWNLCLSSCWQPAPSPRSPETPLVVRSS